jgi:predicted SnoaL-like aldol condensation-catalyzing enzyme
MSTARILVASLLMLSGASAALAQAPPVPIGTQADQIKSKDPKLAANKKLVFDMYRTIVNAGRADLAEQFFTPGYIQHNPNVESGRDALVAYIKKTRPARPIPPEIGFPVISIMAEGDMVLVASVSYQDDPENPGKKYAGTHFDLYRVENGKIAEHWDNVVKDRQRALTTDPNVTTKKP